MLYLTHYGEMKACYHVCASHVIYMIILFVQLISFLFQNLRANLVKREGQFFTRCFIRIRNKLRFWQFQIHFQPFEKTLISIFPGEHAPGQPYLAHANAFALASPPRQLENPLRRPCSGNGLCPCCSKAAKGDPQNAFFNHSFIMPPSGLSTATEVDGVLPWRDLEWLIDVGVLIIMRWVHRNVSSINASRDTLKACYVSEFSGNT